MNFHNIQVIYRKELLDSLRDRRTLISMVLVPVLMFPVMILGMGIVTAFVISRMEKKDAKIVILGETYGRSLLSKIREKKGLEVVEVENFEESLRRKEIQAALLIPKDFEGSISKAKKIDLKIQYDVSEIRSDMAQKRLREVLLSYRDEILLERISSLGIEKDFLEPFSIVSENIASEEKMGGMVMGLFLPYLVIILSLSGAMYPAIDMTAGEKERGTLETLLVSSASREEIILGKFAMVFTASVITSLLSLFSLFSTFSIGSTLAVSFLDEFPYSFQLLGIVTLFILMLPLSALFSSLLLAIAVFAKTSKEANSYIHPLMFLIILPAMVSLLPGVELSPRLVFIPIVNTSLLLKEVLMGIYPWGKMWLIFFFNFFVASLGLLGAIRIFQKESVLFRG